MQAWLSDLQHLLAHGDAAVLVTVARVEGVAPREAGTKMIVTRDSARHTIGGGRFEEKAVEIARQVLRDGMREPRLRRLERLVLGPALGQFSAGAVVLAYERLDVGDLGWLASLARRLSAGRSTVRSVSFGSATDAVMLSEPEPGVEAPDCLLWDSTGPGGDALLTETIAPNTFPVVLFGAGHVATALVRVLAALPCRVRWVDRSDAPFPAPETLAALGAANVAVEATDRPAEAVDTAPAGACFVAMTHDDARDLELAGRILRRADYAFFGLLGSHARRRQFEQQLAARGIDPLQIARMQCPPGVEGIAGQAPEIAAVAIAARLLQAVETHAAHARSAPPQPFP
ncbi:xanthine dehydrogenase accessory protein XdhC [Burkholderia sp. WAC0059]|uniref:xanthine dehydrogenase accessory protein XdhC n=1 Tax=Burkholderia sp. WAC0059 TaxID=2066022 RepID=UPI000C7F57CE|nr:xanthine dehydrogenase accessory protein XdhC [Burkholderia sp. WAC0059]PLZ01130.1 xanthine dehydrogenase accessory protein XdhC [Burkholderia sp. WAC0059]